MIIMIIIKVIIIQILLLIFIQKEQKGVKVKKKIRAGNLKRLTKLGQGIE